MKSNFNKIILGTANFGLRYGNKNKKLNDKNIKEILNLAKRYGIKTIDTAQSYGDAEKKLGNYKNNFRFITKISNFKKISKKKIIDIINYSRNNLKVKKIDYLMFHDCREFKKENFKLPKLILKEKNILYKKIGVSIYKPSELYECIKYKHLDCIQIPFNLLDTRWLNINFKKIKKKNKSLELHVRSIFLRGMLPKKIQRLPNWFKDKKKLKIILNSIKKKHKVSLENILFSYVYQQNWIDKIILGVSSTYQLKKTKDFLKYRKSIRIKKNIFNFVPKKILMPKYW